VDGLQHEIQLLEKSLISQKSPIFERLIALFIEYKFQEALTKLMSSFYKELSNLPFCSKKMTSFEIVGIYRGIFVIPKKNPEISLLTKIFFFLETFHGSTQESKKYPFITESGFIFSN